jgi:hypothetical protein
MNMKIPALTDLAKDVKKIAEALTKIAEVAQGLVDNQQGSKGTEKEPVEVMDLLGAEPNMLLRNKK